MSPWTVACQTPLSLGFPRKECCNGLPFPSPGDLPDLGINPASPALQVDSLPTELRGKYISLCVFNSYSSLDLSSKEFVFFPGVFPECLLML